MQAGAPAPAPTRAGAPPPWTLALSVAFNQGLSCEDIATDVQFCTPAASESGASVPLVVSTVTPSAPPGSSFPIAAVIVPLVVLAVALVGSFVLDRKWLRPRRPTEAAIASSASSSSFSFVATMQRYSYSLSDSAADRDIDDIAALIEQHTECTLQAPNQTLPSSCFVPDQELTSGTGRWDQGLRSSKTQTQPRALPVVGALASAQGALLLTEHFYIRRCVL